jgi:hypothetical protein
MIGTNAFVINEPSEIEDVLARLLHAGDQGAAVSRDKPLVMNRDIRLTNEELGALLGNEGTKL